MKKHTCIFIILTFLNITLKLLGITSYVHIDEPIYVTAGIKLLHPEANQEGFNPILFNFQHPPLAEAIIGLPSLFYSYEWKNFQSLIANSYVGMALPFLYPTISDLLFCARILSVAFGALSCILIYFFVFKLTEDKSKALLAYALSIVSPPLLFLSSAALLDIYFLFFFLCTLYFFIFIFEKNPNNQNTLILTSLLILALFSRNFIPLILVPSLIISSKHKKKILFVSFLAVSIFAFAYILPFYEYIYKIYSERASDSSLGLFGPLVFFLNFFTHISTALFFLIIIFIYKKHRPQKELMPLLLCILFLIASTLIIDPKNLRYILTAFPLSIIIISSKFKLNNLTAILITTSLIFALLAIPHFEQTLNPINIFYQYPNERDNTILLHSFLENKGYKSILTDDYTLLILGKDTYTVLLLSNKDMCNNESLFIQYFDAYVLSEGFFEGAYNTSLLVQCSALTNLIANNPSSYKINNLYIFEPSTFKVIH